MKAGIYRSHNGNLIYVRKDRTIAATTLAPSSWPGMTVKTLEKEQQCYIETGTTTVNFWRVSDVPNGCTDPNRALVDFTVLQAREAYLSNVKPETTPEKPRRMLIVGERATGDIAKYIHDKMAADGLVHVVHDEYTLPHVETVHGKMSGGPLSSNLPRVGLSDRTEEKMTRIAAGSKSGVPEAWRNVENAHQYKDLQFEMERVAMQAKGFRLCHAQSARKHRRQGDTVLPSDLRPGAYWWRQVCVQNAVTIKRRDLAEAGVAFDEDGVLRKTANLPTNVGMRPEFALQQVIRRRLNP